MELMSVFVVLLLVAIVAGAFVSWNRRAGEDRRHSDRGGRRTADGAGTDMTQPTSN
jgi:hypothetical protein